MKVYDHLKIKKPVAENFGKTERAIAGVNRGQFGTVRPKFHCQFPFGETLDAEIFERENRLAADKGIGYRRW
jgi:hypothetical protein